MYTGMFNEVRLILILFYFFKFFLAKPSQEKRAQCSDARESFYCFLEAVYENSCDLNPGDMMELCAETCGFC